MKELVGETVLRNRASGEYEPARVFQELDDKNIEDFDHLWWPMLTSGKTRDAHWQWAEKAKAASRLTQYETFAVECDGVTQGLMLLNLVAHARIEEQRGRELTYVELIATAPWNRPQLVDEPKYKGVGRILVGTAISFSDYLGFRGRIGLHSLADSESWYRDVARFTDLGVDDDKRMRYFEMTETQVTAFLADNE